jgi:Protein of unknown function (DUF3632)
MRGALETPLEDIKKDELDETLRAAAVWFIFWGKQMRTNDEAFEKGLRTGDPARGGPLYQGPSGYCKERWELWVSRLGALAEEESLEQETKKLLK